MGWVKARYFSEWTLQTDMGVGNVRTISWRSEPQVYAWSVWFTTPEGMLSKSGRLPYFRGEEDTLEEAKRGVEELLGLVLDEE